MTVIEGFDCICIVQRFVQHCRSMRYIKIDVIFKFVCLSVTNLVSSYGDLYISELRRYGRLRHLNGFGVTEPHQYVGDVTLELRPLSTVLLQLAVLVFCLRLQVAPPLEDTCVTQRGVVQKSVKVLLNIYP